MLDTHRSALCNYYTIYVSYTRAATNVTYDYVTCRIVVCAHGRGTAWPALSSGAGRSAASAGGRSAAVFRVGRFSLARRQRH